MLVAWLPQLISGNLDQSRLYMARKIWLPGCHRLFLISEKVQRGRYRAYAGCLVALADFWKLGQKKENVYGVLNQVAWLT